MATSKSEHNKDITKRKETAEGKFKKSAKEFQDNAGIAQGYADPLLSREIIIEEFENFLDENGLFEKFNSFIAQKGYKPSEFGMEEE